MQFLKRLLSLLFRKHALRSKDDSKASPHPDTTVFQYSFDPRMCVPAGTFWDRQRTEIRKGKFWADEIKKLRDVPEQRLKLALENLPLPAAFREAALALRQIIRSLKSRGEPIEAPLKMLYDIAAYESFTSSVPYLAELQEPGYNAVEMLTEDDWLSLTVDYCRLGYSKLPLLNKTDSKWLVETWGSPQKHSTLSARNPVVWRKAVEALLEKRVKDFNDGWPALSPNIRRITKEEYLARRRG